ncbi:MAG: sugar kinase [Acidobacteria bacterium]|nr:sugar kinase [Acidobacteriota bacterium]
MPPVLVVGSVAYDSVQTPYGTVEEVLGGSATYFSVAASFFTKVCLVACVGRDFRRQDLQVLERHNVDLEGLEIVEGHTFRWRGKYGHDLNDAQTLDTQLNVFANFSPKIPHRYREISHIFLANIDPLIQRKVLAQVKQPVLIACDTMNYWIEGHFESLLETLKRVNILIVNDAETRQLAQEPNLVRAARRILDWGPKALVVKRGEFGALMFQKDAAGHGLSIFGAPAFPLESIFDPTGAGDSFAGGFMGYLAGLGRTDTQAIRQAIIFGTVIASFNVEQFSLERLKNLTFTEIGMRYRQLREMTSFEDIADGAGL